ncbi:MAG: PIN domain-containing protein [Chloroflexota bacterium]|nr:PIN domain-containing protein [Chloroflexota bacterium]
MILVDANLLVYAHNLGSEHHAPAKLWLEEVLETERDVRIGLVTVLAFLRVVTNPRVFARPLSQADAVQVVTTWLGRDNVALCQPTERHWQLLAELATDGQARGPLLMDAHVAALALEHGATLATTDRDFTRFTGLRWFNPLASTPGG